ncbi:AAA family ATPase [Paraburkholderia megapolitana]|uniref:AAA family ATPase n=1 Tax=Paraburkholderia megapolitana TaxID=420953 RepID=UPI0038BD0218
MLVDISGKIMLKLKKLVIENAGAIEKLDLDLTDTADGNPKPLILVGENGSGKTTALSFIVDALLHLSATKYQDVLAQKGLGTLIYRLRSHDIRIGANYSIAYAKFEAGDNEAEYLDRIGTIDLDQLRARMGLAPSLHLNPTLTLEKVVTHNADDFLKVIASDASAFFPSGRKEIPHWLQERALNQERYSTAQRFANNINKDIVIESAAVETATWIMDGLLDRAVGYTPINAEAANQILQVILQDTTAHFAIAPRNAWPRVQIYNGVIEGDPPILRERKIIIPSLGHLSAGQSMLLSMFATIANQGTLQSPRPLSDVEGMVIIDEIEVYLHTNYQRVILPKLIKLFPKIQFVITTHSPTFLMGMKDHFSEDGFEIREMPTGAHIDVDQFSEIGAAVEVLRRSTAFRDEVKAELARIDEQPLLIVEGRSDAIIIDRIWRVANGVAPPFKILSAKGRRALRYLLQDEEFVEEIGQDQRVLGLFDFDEAYTDWHGCHDNYPHHDGDDISGLLQKHRSKNIFAGLLPIPAMRAAQAGERFKDKSNFTIELYFSDAILSAGQNLETILSPGDVQIIKFRGDKVAFAERVTIEADSISQFTGLLDMLKRTLDVQ